MGVLSFLAVSTPDVSLAQAFVAARGGTLPPGALSSLQERLTRVLESARATWPGVVLEGPRFVSRRYRRGGSDCG